MGEAIGAVLGYAVGIAVSPVPIAAVILMMFSARSRSNSLSFMVAWVIGIATVITVVLLLPGLEASDGTPSDTTGWVKLVLGLLLIVGAVAQWRKRPGPGEEAPIPPWMAKIEALDPVKAFGLGFLLSAVNPKNLLLAVAAGVTIGSSGLTSSQTVTTAIVFTLIAGITVIAPVVAFLIAGHRLDDQLDAGKDWLIRNNATVMSVLFVVFAASLIGDAISILTG
jgi:threonine/homoserine/homoserine lactone efflux protein